ncbi:MAG TPA: hypothetical protein VE262_21890 [Blastocatellia bacterium]|nr:hypothetical protein [Blastocatellia bacterium]
MYAKRRAPITKEEQEEASEHQKEVRKKMIAKIHIQYPKLRPDLRHSTREELREARLHYCSQVLGLRAPLESMKRLDDRQLGKVLDAMEAERRQGALPGCNVHRLPPKQTAQAPGAGEGASGQAGAVERGAVDSEGAEIHHLAGAEQVWAINKLVSYLGWSKQGTEKFISKRYGRTNPRLLSPGDANSLMATLIYIASHHDLKKVFGEETKIPKPKIVANIPAIKRKLGIGQNPI